MGKKEFVVNRFGMNDNKKGIKCDKNFDMLKKCTFVYIKFIIIL